MSWVKGDGLAPDDWWLFQRLATRGRDERVELERHLSSRARTAWVAFEYVEKAMTRGGEDALDVVARLLDSAPAGLGPAVVGSRPLEDLVNEDGDALVATIEQLARGGRPRHPQSGQPDVASRAASMASSCLK